jgi:hypothetical protein
MISIFQVAEWAACGTQEPQGDNLNAVWVEDGGVSGDVNSAVKQTFVFTGNGENRADSIRNTKECVGIFERTIELNAQISNLYYEDSETTRAGRIYQTVMRVSCNGIG